jgi:inhibitor of Bruton tyrosine kinase
MSLEDIPALIRSRPIVIQDVALSKFHSAVLTTDPVSNMYVCGVGRGGRLGLGDENTRFRYVPVQGGLADKKVIHVALGQNHTMAITKEGELWTWGSNSHCQLGYALPPPQKTDEEPVSTTPRQVFGPLKKESIIGVAASAIHSVAHTSSSIFCWGKNIGQLGLMDSDSRSLEVQQVPRKVAASLFSSPIVTVSAIDKATTCLLANHTVCVFTSYGYNIVKFPQPGVLANRTLGVSMSTLYDSGRNHISYITSGGDTIAAVSERGDLFTATLSPQKVDARPSETSTTNPTKIKGAITQPQCIWTARKDGVKSISVGENGSVIICTESGAVWRRIKRATIKATSVPGSIDSKRKDFKFQRVPSITKVVSVRSSTFGAFAAIRKDSDVMKEQVSVEDQTLWKDLAPLLSLRGFEAYETKPLESWTNRDSIESKIGSLAYEFLTAKNIDEELTRFLHMNSSQYHDLDMELCASPRPDIRIPVHSWVLAARSSVIRDALATFRHRGAYEMPETFKLEQKETKILLTLDGLDTLSLLNLVLYAYEDRVVPAWNFTRQAHDKAYSYRQVRSESMRLATKLSMKYLEAAVRLQTVAAKSMDQDFRSAIQDPIFFESGDTILELDGAEVIVHSQLLCQRCPFFLGMFHGRSQGQWLSTRRDAADISDKVRIDLKHIDPEAFEYVLKHLYADVGIELFYDVVSDSIDNFSELVLEVMSIANELMLDRLSQICQLVLGRFVTTRNIGHLLNEISPCSVTEFKDAGLEYICLQMESMLENHFLDDLDDDLMQELDDVVRGNQLAQYPFVRSRRSEMDLLEIYPDLAVDIDEERQRRVKEMAFRTHQKEDERKLSTSFKTRFGSLDDGAAASPGADKRRQKQKAVRNEPFSPALRPKDSHVDLMFDMEEVDTPPTTSPLSHPQHALNPKARAELDQLPTLTSPWRDSRGKPIELADEALVSSPPGPQTALPSLSSSQISGGSPGVTPQKIAGNPWGSMALPTARLNIRELMSETPSKSELSTALASQKTKDGQSKPMPAKLSQKERKKQQLQVATQPVQEAQAKPENKPAWEKKSAELKMAAWKTLPAVPQTPPKKAAMSPDMAKAPTIPPNPKPLVAAETSNTPRSRRTASPDTRFSGQSRVDSSPGISPAACRRPPQALQPHSRSYITKPPKSEPVLGLSMADIIGEEQRSLQIKKEAVAKRSLQEIQQEQAFQEWWDQESQRTQEEEAKRLTRDKEREKRERDGRKSNRGRGWKPRAGGGFGGGDKGGEARASSSAAATSPHGRGGRGRGRKA